MDIKLLSKVFCAHGCALQMPARKTITPRRCPAHDMSWFGFFPKGKVLWVFLFRLPCQSSCVTNHILKIPTTKLSVMVVFIESSNIKIYRAIYLVCIALFYYLFYNFNLFYDVSCGSGFNTWW